MVVKVMQACSYKRRFLFAMLYAAGIPANPLASDTVLENALAGKMVQLGSEDPEMPDNLFNIAIFIMKARGLETSDIKNWGTAALKGGTDPKVSEYETISEVANSSGYESLGDNLSDIGNKLGKFDLIGAAQEGLDTLGDLFSGIFLGKKEIV